MSWEFAIAIYGVVLAATLALGAPIGSAMGLVGIVGVTIIGGMKFWPTFGDIIWNTANSFTLVAVPLFVLMGEIILRSGISRRFYAGLSKLTYGVRGGLAQSNIVGCAVFAAISGSSTATALTIGTVALPEMRSRAYKDELTLGTLAAGGCLGILIPPSVPLVIYASVAQESVIDLFAAGVVPGIALALLFMVYVMIRVSVTPGLIPGRLPRPGLLEVALALRDSLPIAVLILAVLGGMYFGIVTPTEAAGFGCLVALIISAIYRELTWGAIRDALRNAVVTNAVVMFIIINSQVLSYAVTTSGIGRGLSAELVSLHLPGLLFFTILVVLYLVLGMFIDGISMMLLTVPLLYPSILAAGFDGVWFGILLVVLIELGQLTPPMGLNLFAIQSISGGVALGSIARSAMPFAIVIAAFCFLLYFFPELALWLPHALKD